MASIFTRHVFRTPGLLLAFQNSGAVSTRIITGAGSREARWAARMASPMLVMGTTASCEDPEDKTSALLAKLKGTFSNIELGEIGAAVKGVAAGEVGSEELAKAVGKQANAFLESGMGGQLSWGFFSGFCSGYALKKMSKVVAVVFGGLFCTLQGLSYGGYVDVDYAMVEKGAISAFDLNKDGKLDQEDAKLAYGKIMEVLAFNIPAGSGFATGVVMGLRTG